MHEYMYSSAGLIRAQSKAVVAADRQSVKWWPIVLHDNCLFVPETFRELAELKQCFNRWRLEGDAGAFVVAESAAKGFWLTLELVDPYGNTGVTDEVSRVES